MLFHAFLYISYALLNTAAMAAAKSAMRRLDASSHAAAAAWLAAGGLAYVVVLGVMLLLLKDGAASTVFPIAIGCTVVVTNLVGARFYAERFSARKLTGLLLLTGGVALTFVEGARQ
jgi:multidrug transporter EmrE-like cation transporter